MGNSVVRLRHNFCKTISLPELSIIQAYTDAATYAARIGRTLSLHSELTQA